MTPNTAIGGTVLKYHQFVQLTKMGKHGGINGDINFTLYVRCLETRVAALNVYLVALMIYDISSGRPNKMSSLLMLCKDY